MDRLTIMTPNGAALKMEDTYPNENVARADLMRKYLIAVERLAAYEDTGLTPEEVAELAQAQKDGRLVVLPCKVGDVVFAAESNPVIPLTMAYVGAYLDGADGGDWEKFQNFGKTVFLTREEAEAALKKNGGGLRHEVN